MTLTGLDASNPLAFLAAIGTLRLLHSQDPAVRMHWKFDGAWRPILTGLTFDDEDSLCRRLLNMPAMPADLLRESLGKNLTVSPGVFEAFIKQARGLSAEFGAAFGSEVCIDTKKDRIEYTELCFITGSGHQDFIETARSLLARTTADHLREALFGPWRRADPGLSFRWDPSDAAEYALQWDNPGPQGVTSVWGANRLAIEAMPLFPVMPTVNGLMTTGFQDDAFTWPVWDVPIGCDTVRSLLSLNYGREELALWESVSYTGPAGCGSAREPTSK
jgi:hypothetical protein